MPKQHTSPLTWSIVRLGSVGLLATGVAFSLGLQTSGDVSTVQPLQASELVVERRGDLTGDGFVTQTDADLLRTYLITDTLPRALYDVADVDGDGRRTLDDWRFLLQSLPRT